MSDNSEAIDLTKNHPPMPADVFDREYLKAQGEVLSSTPPHQIIAHHRWMGTDEDRTAGAAFVAKRLGYVPEPGRVVVTNGTQSALVMLCASLIGRGGVLLTEELTYPPLLTFARHFGVRLVPVSIDDDGLQPDALRTIIERERPTALYAVPTYQNPTTSIMSEGRRREIADILRSTNVQIIEDDIYSLLSENMPPPISSLVPELSWYILGTAKSIAAGMKVAYVVAPDGAAAEKRFWPGVRGTHWMSTPISAAVMTRLVQNGGADRILLAVVDEVRNRQRLVEARFADVPFVSKPEALHVWIELPTGMNRDTLNARAQSRGLLFGTSDQYVVGSATPPEAVRIGIGNPATMDILETALDQFVDAYRA